MTHNALIFGAFGSIGNYIYNSFLNENINVIGTTTNIEKIKENTMNLSENSCSDKELFSITNVKENTMNLYENSCSDKEIFSVTNVKENTMNLYENSCSDKELFSITNVKENTMNLSEHSCSDKELFSATNVKENTIYVDNNNLENLKNIDEVDIIVWAHGYNFNDNINNYDNNNFNKMIEANVSFILNTLNFLLKNNKIKDSAKLVIISSIWEEFTRENKLSYSISKAALSGLVKNLSYDLSSKNILINNVLPGVIDNDMSRKTLSKEQFDYIKNYMNFNRLITLEDVYKTVKFLAIENTGITGQSIKVDLGFTNLRKYN
jgi:3-oxoacyl-[acyl-carrier protein] reductase